MSGSGKTKIYIVFYSMYGHITKLAQQIAKGVESTGAEVKMYQVAETLPKEVLQMMHAPPKADYPVATFDKLEQIATDSDGIIFGFPTRYGMMPAQMKAFFDMTGQLWQQRKLINKPASMFTSTSTQGGGQETTILTSLTQLTHHGMLYVPIGYGNPSLFNMSEIHGGTPYGAGTLSSGDNSRQPSELELNVAEYQGKYFAKVAEQVKLGKEAQARLAN